MSEKLFRLLKTAVVLSEQFQATLDTTPQAETTSTSTGTTTDPLVLLSDSAKTLRSQVTKLSLLAITSPFTPSAISTVVGAANDSALPSLVTAALLLTPGEYTRAFTSEARVLAKTALREFSTLVEEVLRLANRHEAGALTATQELPAADKDVITSRTGRVWDACDTVIDLVSKGVVGFVAGRVQQWHDLIKDAINELEEWDPEDDTDFDDLLGSGDEDGEDDDDKEPTQEEKNQIEALNKQKKSSLRVIKPIAQIYPAIISNRLKKKGGLTASKSQIQKLESLSSDLQSIPGHVDEAAGSLYEGSVTDSVRYLRLAKTTAERAIQLVSLPWRDENDTSNAEDKEDKFTVWSRTWMKVMADVIQDA